MAGEGTTRWIEVGYAEYRGRCGFRIGRCRLDAGSKYSRKVFR